MIQKEQIETFLWALDSMVKKAKEEKKSKNMYVKDFIARGVSNETLAWLKTNHYIQIKNPSTPVWISWKNTYYPDATIIGLRAMVARM